MTLLICLDIPKFHDWKRKLGPVELFYANPFGIEVYYKENVWGISVGGYRLYLPLKEKKVYPIGVLHIKKIGEEVEVTFARPDGFHKDIPTPVTFINQPAESSSISSRVLPQKESHEREEELPNRLLNLSV